MKKYLLLFLLSVLIFLGYLAFESFRFSSASRSGEVKYCNQQEDCSLVRCGCDCSGGGFPYDETVNRKFIFSWYLNKKCLPANQCLDVPCPNRSLICENHVCTVKEQNVAKKIEVIGYLRTSGLSVGEKETFNLPKTDFQITDFGVATTGTDIKLSRYFIRSSKVDLSGFLGKCVEARGFEVENLIENHNWDKFWLSSDSAIDLNSILEITSEKCFKGFDINPSPSLSLDIFPEGKILTFKGVIQHSLRPAPDIAYDYKIVLDEPYLDKYSSVGGPEPYYAKEYEINIFDALKYVGKHVVLEGYLAWGYAESRYFVVTKIVSVE